MSIPSRKPGFPLFCFSLFAILFLFAVVGAGYSYLSMPVPESPPALIVKPSVLNFGKIKPAFHEGKFLIINQSGNKVTILDIHKTCSCTFIALPRKEMEPNSQMELLCHFDANGRQGKTGAKIAIVYSIHDGKLAGTNTGPQYLVLDLIAEVEQ